MLSKLIVLLLMTLKTLAYTPSTDSYALAGIIPMLSATNFLFDGPASISNAPTTPTTNQIPTVQQMKYYNYYSASMYCQYQLYNLSCEYCQKFKGDIEVRYQRIIINNETDNTAMITLSTTRQEIVVTFRGSQNPWNAVLGLSMINVCYDNSCDYKLHSGFFTATMSIYYDVVNYVGFLLNLNQIYKNYKVVITGHSLGAALARITTFFLLFLDQFPEQTYELYTYAEPRVGNKAFADFMNRQNIVTARITARADIVPHLMPTSVLGTQLLGDYYVHPQTEFWINGSIGTFADQYVYEDPDLSNSMGPAYTVVDHFLYFDANYLVCWLNQPQVWLAIPFNVFQPVGTIPPLPEKISNFLSYTLGLIGTVLGPLLG